MTGTGWQFTCPGFTGALAKHEIGICMDGKGAWQATQNNNANRYVLVVTM
jgi:hypothetical protein